MENRNLALTLGGSDSVREMTGICFLVCLVFFRNLFLIGTSSNLIQVVPRSELEKHYLKHQ